MTKYIVSGNDSVPRLRVYTLTIYQQEQQSIDSNSVYLPTNEQKEPVKDAGLIASSTKEH